MTDPTAHELDEPRTVREWLDRYWSIPSDGGEGVSFSAFRSALVSKLGDLPLPSERARLQADPGLLRTLDHPAMRQDHDKTRWPHSESGMERGPVVYWCARCVLDAQSERVAALAATPAEPEAIDVERLADMAEMAAGEVMTGNDWGRYHKAIREHFKARLERAAEYARLPNPAQRETPEGAVE